MGKRETLSTPHDKQATALVVVDPYNDFFSRLGRTWPMMRDVAGDNDVVAKLARLLQACRSAGVLVAYAPHVRYRPGVFSSRHHPAPSQILVRTLRLFRANGRGGRFHPRLAPSAGDLIAGEHETSCGFTGTDLDARLQARGIAHVIVVGAISNTCVSASGRTAADLGYAVTFVEDCVTAQTRRDHRAALRDYPQIGRSMTLAEILPELAA